MSAPQPGDRMQHLYNGRLVRQVRIVSVNEEEAEALVHVLYGPLRGARWFVPLADLVPA